MPSFDLLHLLTWLHFVALAAAVGGAVSALLILGLEEVQPQFQGLSAALWARQVRWGIRIAFVLGILMRAACFKNGGCPLAARYLQIKLPLAVLALALGEMAPKALAARKRGAALLALLLLLVAGFVAINKGAFQGRPKPAPVFGAPAVSPK